MRSGGLMIECLRRQQSVNLLALKHIHNIEISSSHRTLNSSRGIIPYRDDDLSELTDGVTHVKCFTSKRNGQVIKLNTFLITFIFPTVPSSLRMGLYKVRVSPYVQNPVPCFKCQKFGHGKGQCKGKLKCFRCGEEDHEGLNCNNDPKCSNCGQSHMASSKDCQFFQKEKEIQKIKTEKIFHTLRHVDSSLRRMIQMCRNRMLVASNLFSIRLHHKLCSPGLKTRVNQPDLLFYQLLIKLKFHLKRHQVHRKQPELQKKLQLQYHLQAMKRNLIKLNILKVNSPVVLHRDMVK